MNVLVIGSGGREYAMTKALKLSDQVQRVFALPGSSAISLMATLVEETSLDDFQKVLEFCVTQQIELVCFGPEAPLVAGLSDFLRQNDIRVFGPNQSGALLEGDKLFSKEFMKEFKIPTGDFIPVTDKNSLMAALDKVDWSTFVFKYKDLAGGKGVIVTESKEEVLSFAEKFGVTEGQTDSLGYLEEPLYGWELSYICLVNETGYKVCPILQDHKRLMDQDEGPNTGGMGVVGPLEVEEQLEKQIQNQVVEPTLEGLKKRDILYRGVIYFGIMVTEEGPKLLEYNVRFGDPEAQLIFPLTKTDWADVMMKVAHGEEFDLPSALEFGACVVLAAKGYPTNPEKGAEIKGCESDYIYHAGTKKIDSSWVVNGGRVLNVLGFGSSVEDAIKKSYGEVEKVSFQGMQFRRDIGSKSL